MYTSDAYRFLNSSTDVAAILAAPANPPILEKCEHVIPISLVDAYFVLNVAAAAGLGTIVDSVAGGVHKRTLTLNAGVTSSQVESFLRSITFSTSKTGLNTTSRTLQVSVTDKHGTVSNLVTQTVNVKKK